MRGPNHEQDYIFSYHSPADRVPSVDRQSKRPPPVIFGDPTPVT